MYHFTYYSSVSGTLTRDIKEHVNLSGYTLDPIHPAIEISMNRISDLFHRCGFQYVKLDFLTHGRMKADNIY